MEIRLTEGEDVAGALAAVMGSLLLVVGLFLVVLLAFRVLSETEREHGKLRQRFDDAWWALRQAAAFTLALMTLGAILLLVPTLTPSNGTPEPTPTPSVEPSEGEPSASATSGAADESAQPSESAGPSTEPSDEAGD